MQDPPKASELTGAVRDFLQSEENQPGSERSAFLRRVAINVLGIVERELEMGAAADAAERDRLRGILNQDGTTEELNRELCRRIRRGAINQNHPLLRTHLRATTLAKLAIDQPKYSGYVAAMKNGGWRIANDEGKRKND